ncbi:hypothetical protein AOE01nite_01850 [Acetobacter oeni]|uniref:Uncharacterized protein n=1 Tax=Acetobacter oeni TaxID=304077 RepID=A0A511XGD3_9PROT|nr:hypothetical protein AOE01nite_01850 [Acetobacter oeni]
MFAGKTGMPADMRMTDKHFKHLLCNPFLSLIIVKGESFAPVTDSRLSSIFSAGVLCIPTPITFTFL